MDLPLAGTSAVRKGIWILLLAVICVTGGIVRFAGIGRDSFWFNEAASYYYAKSNLTEVIRHSWVDETNPPGFHVLIHFWMKIAGISEASLRIPSALAGLLAIPLIYLFARLFLAARGALIACALFAFSPLHVWYSQECRGFAFWVLFTLAAYLCFFRWVHAGKRRWLVLDVLFLFLGMSFHYFGMHALVIENAYLLVIRRQITGKWRQWLVSQILLVLLISPLLVMMVMVDRTNVNWWKESGVTFETLKALVFHLNGVFFFLSHERLLKGLVLLSNAAMLVLGCWSFRKDRRSAFLLLACLEPILVNLAVSLTVSPVFGNAQSAGRYFLITLPPYLVLLACGWERVFGIFRRPAMALLLFLAFLSVYAYGIHAMRTNQPFLRDDNRRLCSILFERAAPGDLLVVSPFITVDYYAARLHFDLSSIAVAKVARKDGKLPEQMPPEPRRIWLFFDPVHRFNDLIRDVSERYHMRIALEEQALGLSGAALFLLEPSPEGK
jgi:4-amino-4-deoxy-L-arabinose transferase-like glycosyltransferase